MKLLDDKEWHAKLTAAVVAAEKTTKGEIVVVLARAADDGLDAAFVLAAIVATAILGMVIFTKRTVPHAGVVPLVVGIYVVTLLAASRWEWPRRIFTRRARRARASREAARASFFTHHVAATPERLGVLVHVALRERLVHVIPDTAAEAKVPPATWHAIEHRARGRRIEDALPAAIAEVGAALAAVAPSSGERPNELDDAPRVER